ncbi:DUF2141 domain-containing protein [Novosphingobium sp. FSY-8]|uniref:DUF2141 domain-containing protein n=1 Tax=Novosphingobium ovatum TaxID=1908523 RepID=A0ABW9XH80_9SPHN|nr:DUF2141 domain-containing protein [Novosphingobium ovatum]NBC37841.1 DUF2141 domain-containing protein [Novosphingobium ovatum]
MLMAALLLADAVVTPGGASVTVQVTNVRNANGRVLIALCRKAQFLKETCPINASAPAQPGVTTVVIDNVPPGEWAAQGFLDENNNKKVDQMLFGIPKEGVGFSRDARIVMGPPKWADAVFVQGSGPQVIRFALRYFMGPGSPEAWAKAHPK